MIYTNTQIKNSQEQKQWRLEFPLSSWKQTHQLLNPNYKFFNFPQEAKDQGFQTKTFWKSKKREVLCPEPNSPFIAIVPNKIYKSVGVSFLNQPILYHNGNNLFTDEVWTCDYLVYYKEEATVPKGKKSEVSVSSLISSFKKNKGEGGGEREIYNPPNDAHQVSGKNTANIEILPSFLTTKTTRKLTVPKDWWKGINIPNYVNVDKVNYVFDRMIIQMVFNRTDEARLKAKYLVDIIGWQDRKPVLEWMERNELINWDKQYKIGCRAMTYSLGGRVKNNSYMSVFASQHIIDRLSRLDKELTPIETHIKSEMDRIDINEPEALLTSGDDKSQEWIIKTIHQKQWRMDRDDYGRLHTNITNLNKEARKSLTIDGEATDEPDVSSCQMLLLGSVVRAEGLLRAEELIALCESGKFYETFDEDYPDRQVAKHKIIVELLFGRYSYTAKSKVCQRFGQMFPEIYAWITELKKKNYKLLSHKLQRAESRIMIDLIGSSLKNRGIHFHPIYDCILCKKSDTEEVLKIMREQFAAEGLTVHLKVK